MNNYELKRYLSSYDVHVVCADDLSVILKKRQFWIVNTDTCGGRGLHWVALHFPPKGPIEFFDSLGNCPEYYQKRFQNILIFNGPRYLINMSIQESSQRPLPCVDITVYISYYIDLKDAQ